MDALEAGRIAGAALDVYDREPLPPDHRLRRIPNLLLTPHIGYVTRETYKVFYADMVEDIAAFLAGRPQRVIGRDLLGRRGIFCPRAPLALERVPPPG